MKLSSLMLFILIFIQAFSAVAEQPKQKAFYKEFELFFEPSEVILVYSTPVQDLMARHLTLSKLPASSPDKRKYAVFSLVDADMQAGQLLVSGKEHLSIAVSGNELTEREDFYKQQPGNPSTLNADLQFLETEVILEQKKLAKLRKNVAEISRLNRLVQAENTATSLERRLKELQQDKEALASLINLIPAQQLTPRQIQIENRLVLDAREIGQIFAKNGGLSAISPEKEQQLKNQIEAASRLNADDLKRKLIELKKMERYEPEDDAYYEYERGSRDNPL